MFSHRFLKGNNSDILFASLDNKAIPKLSLLIQKKMLSERKTLSCKNDPTEKKSQKKEETATSSHESVSHPISLHVHPNLR